ncbi:hypothetical protein [Streptomyces globosus]|uniref:hypothetical protein n=1 Tax=Streptomyces globosus TaxID=68209 RepID=UPI0013B36DA2|nr:hypothetical protein [Streptomyces globosus]
MSATTAALEGDTAPSQWRGFASNFDAAADRADGLEVRLALAAVATDMRLYADALEARNSEALQSIHKQRSKDLQRFLRACGG